MLFKGRIFGRILGRPQSLGEGLQRVVKAAGNDKAGRLKSSFLRVQETPRCGYITSYGNRTYSNGVTIEYGTLNNGGGYGFNNDVLRVSNNNDEIVSGIYRQNKTCVYSPGRVKMINGKVPELCNMMSIGKNIELRLGICRGDAGLKPKYNVFDDGVRIGYSSTFPTVTKPWA